MAAIKAAYESALDELRAAGAKLKAIGHTGWTRVEQVLHELEGDAPALEQEAEADAEHVAQTAATQGIKPAEAKAAADAAQLAAEAGHDVVTAVEDAAHTPADGAATEPSA
jgi:peptidoglycan hydrolase CwlO-like protein